MLLMAVLKSYQMIPIEKYHETIELPQEIDIESAKSTYNNGILEVTFNRKKETKPKGKEIKIE